MMRIVRLVKVCGACPSSWDGKADEGQDIHIKYRYGRLRVWINSEPNLTNASVVFEKKIGGDLDGVMDFTEVQEILKDFAVFECKEEGLKDEDW